MKFEKENVIVINAGKLKETIMEFARNHGYSYTHVCCDMMHINASDLWSSIKRYNQYNPGADNAQMLGYVTKRKFKEIMYGYNTVFAAFSSVYPDFREEFVPKGKDNGVLGSTVVENKPNGVYAHCKFDNTESAQKAKDVICNSDAYCKVENKTALNSIYGIGINADKQVSSRRTKLLQAEIGKTSNLITNMIVQGASEEEILTAVKYSRYLLDFDKLREKIQELYKKYYCAKKD